MADSSSSSSSSSSLRPARRKLKYSDTDSEETPKKQHHREFDRYKFERTQSRDEAERRPQHVQINRAQHQHQPQYHNHHHVDRTRFHHRYQQNETRVQFADRNYHHERRSYPYRATPYYRRRREMCTCRCHEDRRPFRSRWDRRSPR